MSIIKGCSSPIDNNDLVRIAARENIGAQIIYKPHPEVLRGIRKDPPQSNPNAVRGIAMILDQDVTLADAFNTVDHVYTITSLSGFEALIRGIKVTCLGMPFYAGWGATDDRQKCARRTAKHTAEEIFAAAYILYPRYFDPILKKEIEFEQALELLYWMKQTQPPEVKKAPKVDPPLETPKPAIRLLATNTTKTKIKAIREVLDILDPPIKRPVVAKPKKPPLKAAQRKV
jgi:capsular polysaccharide export protein